MRMTPERWNETCDYLNEVFGVEDEHLAGLMQRAQKAGLPDIAVDASVGRLLLALTRLSGARVAVEIGTLGGYSGIWIARGLAEDGRLYTLESEPRHAEFAEKEFRQAGVADRVEIRVGSAVEELPRLVRDSGYASADLLFLDADKTEYDAYLDGALPMLRPGAMILADNALGGGDWWITDAEGDTSSRDAVDAFNRRLVDDPRFDAACVPLREGLLIARYKGG